MKKFLCLLGAAVLCASTVFGSNNCTPFSKSYLPTGSSGLGEMTQQSEQGDAVWNYQRSYGAVMRGSDGVMDVDWLIAPAFDARNAGDVTISFKHTHKFALTPEKEFTLWISSNYTGDAATTQWTQLTIPTYGSNTDWTYVTATVSVPANLLGASTVVAFRYQSPASGYSTWEIKDLEIKGECQLEVPEAGNGRLKICAQNLENYYYNYESTQRIEMTAEEFAAKTRLIVRAMLAVDADIYAFCEVEAKEIVLQHLADQMNKTAGVSYYKSVADGIDYTEDGYDNHLKSGFIYRTDRVTTIRANTAATTDNYYCNTMRIQAFEEISTGEWLVLSMNHFRAKEEGSTTRIRNANQLVAALKNVSTDPDILIMGDLNCTYGSDPLNILQNAGYEEQLLRFDSAAYSYCYDGTSLIDHVYANSTMAAQIAGTGVYHVCNASCAIGEGYPDTRYSDHDAYIVTINLAGSERPQECENLSASYLATGGSGLGDMKQQSVQGNAVWTYDSSYGAKMGSKNNTDWLFTPTYNLKGAQSVTLSFQHTHKFAGTPSQELTLWVTDNFSGDVTTTQWTQLTIPNYASNNDWTFVSNTVSVPTNLVGSRTAFAFKYVSGDTNYATWEIKNLTITSTCATGLEETAAPETRVRKVVEDGHLYIILPDGRKYTVLGTQVK